MEIRRSDDLGALAESLAKAQLEFGPVKKERENPYYHSKYADLSVLIEATRQALGRNGLSVIQTSRLMNNRAVEISTMLLHSSNQFLASDLVLPAFSVNKEGVERFDAQTIGSAITYGRRYAYQALLNIAAEDDDDGNGVVRPNGNGTARREPEAERKNGAGALTESDTISVYQQNTLLSAVKKAGISNATLVNHLGTVGVETVSEIRRKDFPALLKWATEEVAA